LTRGTQFSWTGFTVHQPFFIVGEKYESCRYVHAKPKRTSKTKCCVKKLKRDECFHEKRSFAVFEMEGYKRCCVYQQHIKWPEAMWKFAVRVVWKQNQSQMPFWTITSTKPVLTGMTKWFPITQWRGSNWSGGGNFFHIFVMAVVNAFILYRETRSGYIQP
jgi:hypothetical protein